MFQLLQGLDRFRKTYPKKYIDVGIAEQNMIGVAAGLSSEGFNVITTTFAPFQTMRCCEQIKVNLGYMKHKVCMVGLASGLVLGTLRIYSLFNRGCWNFKINTINITIISPADSFEVSQSYRSSIKIMKIVAMLDLLVHQIIQLFTKKIMILKLEKQ